MEMVYTQAGVPTTKSMDVQISAFGQMLERKYTFPVSWTAQDLGGFWPSSFSVKYLIWTFHFDELGRGVWWVIGPITYTPKSGEYLIPYESGHEEAFG